MIYSIQDLDTDKVIKLRITDFCNYHCTYCIRRPLVTESQQKQNLQQDMQETLEAIPDVVRIADQLALRHNCKVKVDLIGGEISCSDITLEIVRQLGEADSIRKINITTNLSRDIDWYLKLVSESKKKISMTASFHYEEADFEEYKAKARTLSKVCQFKCETVITKDNKYWQSLADWCDSENIYYMCEENLFDPDLKGTTRRNTKQKPRYKVHTDSGDLYYNTRNEFIKAFGEDGIAFDTAGYKCSRDYDYVYIEKNKVLTCFGTFDIKDYKLMPKPHACPRGKCTLCGHISLT